MAALFVAAGALADSTSWDAVTALKPGTRVKIVRTNLAAIVGKVVSAGEDNVVVDDAGAPKRVDRADVARISHAGQRSKQALIGLAIGAAAGAVIVGVAIAQKNRNLETTDLAYFPGLGAAIGGGAGAALPANEVIYRAPAPKP